MKFILGVFVIICVVTTSKCASYSDRDAQILQSINEVNPDGSYKYLYQTSNGITAQEAGVGGVFSQGAASWYDPKGEPIQMSYIADENGYRVEGNYVPVPPPIPPLILRALAHIRKVEEYRRSHPEQNKYKY